MNLVRLVITLVMFFAVLGCSTEPVPDRPVNTQATKEINNSIGMKLVLIPKGTFQMGSPESEEGRTEDEELHQVTFSKDFFLGTFEVTQAQYEKVMGKNPSFFQGDEIKGDSSRHPVETVSWEDAVEFCKRLSDLPEEKAAGRVYRLPTEAQWEYACRAGTTTEYSFGDDESKLGEHAWYQANSDHKTSPVGIKKPNQWGLYDMHGNVWEWCRDEYGDYQRDPRLRTGLPVYVLRGGDWALEAASCRSACRGFGPPLLRENNCGFRVSLSSPEIPE